MARLWPTGGNHRIMYHTMVNIYITHVMRINRCWLLCLDKLFDNLYNIQPIQRIHTVIW